MAGDNPQAWSFWPNYFVLNSQSWFFLFVWLIGMRFQTKTSVFVEYGLIAPNTFSGINIKCMINIKSILGDGRWFDQ